MSYSISVYNTVGEIVDTVQLDATIFADEHINNSLIHEFILLQQANARMGNAHTKTRAEVSYSGRKLARQKWWGRGRVGDAGTPLRKHGGVSFGPRNTVNWTKNMNKKQKKLALLGCLIRRLQKNDIIWLQCDYTAIQTQQASKTLKDIGILNQKNLVVMDSKNEIISKSFRNISGVKHLLVGYLNPYDILNNKKIIFTGESLQSMITLFQNS